ncbi:MAG: NAD(P)H-binding protein [Myxococcales bacterium]|nr:NAD(P)H-binding protein [Myxococcales bacterium]
MGPAGLRIVVFGGTGLAGRGVVRACLDDPRVVELRAVVRRPLDVDDPRLRQVHCDDFSDLSPVAEAFDGIDAVLYCLGVSASQIDGEAAYRVITYDYALAAGRTTLARSPGAVLHFISGSGTNAQSRMMWARVKGETEQALRALGLGGVVCWRPGMITADGIPPGLPWFYRMGHRLIRPLRWARSLSVHHEDIGRAMLQLIAEDQREGTLNNREIRDAADRYRAAHAG